MERKSGILMPMSSLPSNYGIGTMGRAAYRFVDFLKSAGQKYWQILPLCPTSYGDSPYSSFSTFAGNPYLIDLDMLIKDGLLKPSEVKSLDWGNEPSRVDYGKIYVNRFRVLRLAYSRGSELLGEDIDVFRKENNNWIEKYALFMAVKGHFGGMSWTDWPDEDIRMHRDAALKEYAELLKDEMDFQVFMQYLFFIQWNRLKDYAHKNGIEFIGDLPIYVAMDSADVWSSPQFFRLDEKNRPVEVAGVPPDHFTADGQLWGNPLYDWDAMRDDGYGWWIRRIDGARKLYDLIRIDHFRGFDTYWAVPFGDSTAINGHWKHGPGMDLLSRLMAWFGDLRLIAEDLGAPTDSVVKLLKDSGLPGMKVLMFAFDGKADSDYLPHNCIHNSICYVGTHDNETVSAWVKASKKKDLDFAKEYMGITEEEGWCWGLIRSGMATSSRIFVVQMQDLLELGPECRMNMPGSAYGNWQWRMLPGAAGKELAKKLLHYTRLYRRT